MTTPMATPMAMVPAERLRRLAGPSRIWTELSILFRIQFAIIRDSWVWVILMATLFPLTTILFMSFFVPDPTPETIVRLFAGNMIFGVIVTGLNGLGNDISWQKHQGHFTFYASLPIYKLNFVAANLVRGLMNTLPSFLILGMLGRYAFHIDMHFSWGLPLVILLSLSSIVGIGVLVGFWSPNHNLTNMLTQAMMMLITFLSPVMVEIGRLPLVVQWISYLLPTTYAADAMREVLLSGWSRGVGMDCLMMVGFSGITVYAINRLVSWRVRR